MIAVVVVSCVYVVVVAPLWDACGKVVVASLHSTVCDSFFFSVVVRVTVIVVVMVMTMAGVRVVVVVVATSAVVPAVMTPFSS